MKKIQLSIPEPCQQHWDDMTLTQQGRYCNACAKEVIDFSNMSDRDVLNYFVKKKDEKVCGSVYPDQLDRNIYAAEQKKKYWQWQYILTAFLFFMKPVKSKAQGMMVRVTSDTTHVPTSVTKATEQSNKKNFITGMINDEDGKPVPYVTVTIKGTSTGTQTDENGRFSIKNNKNSTVLIISAVGYITTELKITGASEKQIVLKTETKIMKEIVVTSSSTYTRGSMRLGGMRVKGEMIGTSEKTIKDTIISWVNPMNNSIKIYPNPLPKGNTFTVTIKLKQTGSYTIQIMDAAGRLLTENKITATAKEWKEQIASSSTWSAGVHYVKLVDEKGKLVSSGSLLIQ